jgi:hypothetical protein
MLVKILILMALAMILISLFSALAMFFNHDDANKRKRIVQTLTIRVGLSIGLFVVLLLSIYLGLIPAKG